MKDFTKLSDIVFMHCIIKQREGDQIFEYEEGNLKKICFINYTILPTEEYVQSLQKSDKS